MEKLSNKRKSIIIIIIILERGDELQSFSIIMTLLFNDVYEIKNFYFYHYF